jgi:hypothetical protein
MYAYSRIYIHILQANSDYNNSQNKRPSTAKAHVNGDSSGNAATPHLVAPVRPHQQHIHLQNAQQHANGNVMQPQARAAMPLAGIASAPALASTNTGSIPVVAGSIPGVNGVVANPAGGAPPGGMRMAPSGNGMDWVFC